MVEPRRRRAATTEKLTRVLDATEEIMLSDGYAAVTSRNVAARVGIQSALLHYYFATIDDLFVAVLRRRTERNADRLTTALTSSQPLRTWWDLAADPRGTALFVELMAAGNHRPAIRTEVAGVARELRRVQMEALTTLLPEYGIDPTVIPPALFAAALQGLAFGLVTDEAAGYDTAHKEARAAMSKFVARLEKKRARADPERPKQSGRAIREVRARES